MGEIEIGRGQKKKEKQDRYLLREIRVNGDGKKKEVEKVKRQGD